MTEPSSASLTGQGALSGLMGSGALLGGATAGPATSGGLTGMVTWTPPGTAAWDQITRVGRWAQQMGQPAMTMQPVTDLPENLMTRLSGLGQAELDDVRRKLYTSGQMPAAYYGRNAMPLPTGGLDADTAAGFYNAAKLASLTGNLDQLLGAVAPQAAGQAGQEREPLVIELPSETDLAAVLRAVASDTDGIGRDPTDEELRRFTESFRSRSAAYQRAAYAAGGSGLSTGSPGGTVEKPGEVASAAKSFVRTEAPVEFGAQRMEKGLGVLFGLVTGKGA